MLLCKICMISFENVDGFICHTKALHKYLEYFVCGFSHCLQRTNSIPVLKKHILKHNCRDLVLNNVTYNHEFEHTITTHFKECLESDIQLTQDVSNAKNENNVSVADYIISFTCINEDCPQYRQR